MVAIESAENALLETTKSGFKESNASRLMSAAELTPTEGRSKSEVGKTTSSVRATILSSPPKAQITSAKPPLRQPMRWTGRVTVWLPLRSVIVTVTFWTGVGVGVAVDVGVGVAVGVGVMVGVGEVEDAVVDGVLVGWGEDEGEFAGVAVGDGFGEAVGC